MELIDPKILEYAGQHTTPETGLLQELNRETHLKVIQPQMLSGHLQGRILALFSRLLQPKRILEIGTYTGYSALCLCEGLAPDGKLITLDINPELEDMTRGYFERAGVADKIDYRIGDAREIVPRLEDTFDLVFIDADKKSYPLYYDMVIDKIRAGGCIIADNVLREGRIIEPSPDNSTRVMQQFNEKVHQDPRVDNLVLPVRDGLMICRKTG